MDKYTGKRLDGRYEIQELIGVGGMAVVYKAYDTIDDRAVAVKILKDEFLGNQEFIRRFKNESKAIAVLDHPNIVKVYDVSFGDRLQYIVMEYIDGISLKEYLNQQKEIRWKEALHFTMQILRALQHAHEKGIIHRDIKPQNIMLLQDGTIKVTDFGIARFSHSETRTMTDKAIGSVHYIAPEQARGDLTDDKADIYSVGVMLYEMITGQLPFEADNAVSVAIMQLQADPKPPRDINPTIPIGLEEITLKAMQKTPAQRYQSAEEMMQDIEKFRQNPLITFNYKYGQEETATKYVDATTANSTTGPIQYDDDFEYIDDDISSHSKGGKTKSGNKNKVPIIVVSCLAAAIVIALGVGGYFLFSSMGGGGNTSSQSSSDEVDLPNFVGQKLVDIQNNDEYKNFNFKVETKEDNTVEEGVVISQSPSGSKKVKANAQITLTVSSGKKSVEVTDLSNMTQADAEASLNKLGLKYEVQEINSDTVAKGLVVKTDPQSGSSLAHGSTVTLYISKGPEIKTVSVPNVVGSTIDNAKSAIINVGLKVGNITYRDDSKAKGTVLEVSPSVGTSVTQNTSIDLVVSSGATEKTANISFDLPRVSHDVTIYVYLDGTQYQSPVTVNPELKGYSYNLSITGKSGVKTLSIKIDTTSNYRVYSLDFDKGTWNQTGSNSYVDTQASDGND
ncbi:MAG: Stk1 family PASTA domain-containing Ser/Thr kinase [Clostridium sp.]|nr:Stk1 family PASTA domain-containing Ser/Thr kinase [Clostridium sp.]